MLASERCKFADNGYEIIFSGSVAAVPEEIHLLERSSRKCRRPNNSADPIIYFSSYISNIAKMMAKYNQNDIIYDYYFLSMGGVVSKKFILYTITAYLKYILLIFVTNKYVLLCFYFDW